MVKFYPCLHKFLFVCITIIILIGHGHAIAGEKPKLQKIRNFIPPDYALLDSASGDLNGDGLTDYVLILENKSENSKNSSGVRPLLLLLGTEKNNLELAARNDSVVLCKSCGGIYDDPFQKVTIRDGFLSVQHLIGSTWKWTRVISFKYDSSIKDFVLDKDEGVSYHVANPNRKTGIINNKDDFGKLKFSEFSYNKGY
jgi:hypothetical protein